MGPDTGAGEVVVTDGGYESLEGHPNVSNKPSSHVQTRTI